MRIGVVTTQAPFIIGGAERHAANLVAALRARGHEATEISLPYKWFPGRVLVDHVLAAKLTDLSDLGYPVDRVIGLKFPAYLVNHPDKVYWVLHQHRQAYDLWEAGLSELQHDPDGPAVRALIRAEDRAALGAPGARVWANSGTVAGRMERYLGILGTPLYHPPPNAGRLRAERHGDFLFAPSRLGPNKRQALMIEALAHAPGVRLVIAGPPDAPDYPDELRRLAKRLGVADRVELLGPISDAEMLARYATARAVVFVPIDEDLGYITLEAMLAERPVITATDAGGPLEFVADGREGLVVAPEPAALGAAFARIMDSPAEAEAMGRRGLETYRAKGIGWDQVVETLADGAAPDPAAVPAFDAAAAAHSDPEAPVHAAGGPGESDASASTDPDLATLAARIAPFAPAQPVPTVDEIFARYDLPSFALGPLQMGELTGSPYFATHWPRYAASLAMIEEVPGTRILDVGIVPPFVFEALLADARPGAEIAGVWQAERPFAQTVRARAAGARDFHVRVHPADVERDPLPGADGSRDIVLAMEILEHLAADPAHFLAEANRVLAPGGHLLVTTPNMASHRNAAKPLAGTSAYSFGLFVPVGGVHGRHNREYAPHEVRALGEAAGFETVALRTSDLYGDRIDPEMAARLAAREDDFALRGEVILWLGRKAGSPATEAPEGIYHGRPAQLSGRLRLIARGADGVVVGARNTSRADWAGEGPFAIGLLLSWIDGHGVIRHTGGQVTLPGPVPVGAEAEVALDTGPHDRTEAGRLRIELYESGSGLLTGAGRANAVEIPCDEAGFLRLAGAAP